MWFLYILVAVIVVLFFKLIYDSYQSEKKFKEVNAMLDKQYAELAKQLFKPPTER